MALLPATSITATKAAAFTVVSTIAYAMPPADEALPAISPGWGSVTAEAAPA